MKNKLLLTLALTTGMYLQAQAQGVVIGITEKVKEIVPGTTDGGYPWYLHPFNGNTLLFSAKAANGRELWITDGTSAGTQEVKDLNPGVAPSSPRHFNVINGNVYFVATDGTAILLWKTDGTASGTEQIGTSDMLNGLFAYNSSLLFAGWGPNGYELWKSDGTAAGTQELIDLNTGSGDSYPMAFTQLDTRVVFAAMADGIHNSPCITDGTALGTQPLAPISVNIAGGSGAYEYSGKEAVSICTFNGEAYFAATDGTYGFELWKTDGTPAGTVMVKDIAAAADASTPYGFRVFKGKLYFGVSTGNPAIDGLWTSDGTAAGTSRLKAGISVGDGNAVEYVEMGGKLYFAASGKVWETDGTVSGTRARLNSPDNPLRLTLMNGKLYCFGTSSAPLVQFTLFQMDNLSSAVVPVSFPLSNTVVPTIHTDTLGKYIYFAGAPETTPADIELYRFKDTTFTINVENVQANATAAIYPNPATNSFSVKLQDNKNASVYVYSLNGQLLLQSEKTEDIDIAKLPAGIYTVQIINDGKVSVGKLRKE